MNDLQTFQNNEFGEIRVIEINNEGWLIGKDVTEKLGYQNGSRDINRHVDEGDKQIIKIHDGYQLRDMIVINESGLYALVLGSELPNAKKFRKWVTSEILPSIRKHGAYMTPEKIEEVLLNPDTIIQLATQLKEEQQKRLQAEKQITSQQREIEHKTEVIKGVTEDIDIYTKRNILNKVVRFQGANFSERWNELYDRFREVYSIDLKARCEGYNLKQKQKKDQLSVIKYAERFGHIENLYKIAIKLYETDIDEILKHLQGIA